MSAPAVARTGSQVPTHIIRPKVEDGVEVETLDGTDACEFAARFGLRADPWQSDLSELWMARDAETGRWLAGTWGISVARQNGKNGALEIMELYMIVVLRLNILHTAHQVKTAQKHFRRMKDYFGSKKDDPQARYPELNRLVKEVRSTNGQEAIYLWDPVTFEPLGSIEISARSKGAARGFTNDVLVVDEAQNLKDEHLEALRPAISAAPSGDPVAIYMGTPPRKEALLEDGEGAAFLRIRSRAVSGDAKRSAWMEFGLSVDLEGMSEDEIRDLAENEDNWFRVNPALGLRLGEQTLIDELDEMGPRSFARERLNVWPSAQSLSSEALDLDEWGGSTVGAVPSDWSIASVGIDMDLMGRTWFAIAARSPDPSNPVVHVELIPEDPLATSQDAAVQWVWSRVKKRHPVVIPASSGAAMLEAPLRAKGAKVYRLNVPETVQASAGFVKATTDAELTHTDDPVLAKAVAESGRETLRSGLWRFGRNGDLSGAPLYAVASARFGAVKWPSRRRDGKSRFSN